MKLPDDIVPGKSLGGVTLLTLVDTVIGGLQNHHVLEVSEGIVSIDDGLVTIGCDANRSIYSVMCNSRFKGCYKGKLWAGLTVREVVKNSTTQVAWGGAVVVDGIEGIGLPLPDGFDDFDQLTDHLSLDDVFQHLSIFLP